MTRIKSNINVQYTDYKPVNIDYETDMTIPNQSMSVTEILLNYTRGVGMNAVSRGIYYDGLEDFDADDPTLRPDFDLSDVTSAMTEIQNAQKAEDQSNAINRVEEEGNDDDTDLKHKRKSSANKGVSEPSGEEPPKNLDNK